MKDLLIEKHFGVAVLCENATFGQLLQEARRNNLILLEMIPFDEARTELSAQVKANRLVLFIYSDGKSFLAQGEKDIMRGLKSCSAHPKANIDG